MAQQVVKVVAEGEFSPGVQTRNVFCYGTEAPQAGGYTTCDNVASHLQTAVFGAVILSLSSLWSLKNWSGYYRDQEGHWHPCYQHTVTLQGSAIADITAFQVAGLVTAATSVLKARGRKFFPGIAINAIDGGALSTAALAEFVTAAAAWLAPVYGEGYVWYPGVVSKNSIFAPFTTALVGNILSTIRRRKPGYGI